MSLHRSLKTKPTALNQHRNVLTRAERITKLTETERFSWEKNSPFGLLKVANRLVTTGKKPKKEAVEGEEGAEAGGTPGGAAAPAAGGAGAKAGGAKPAAAKAPAAKSAAPKK